MTPEFAERLALELGVRIVDMQSLAGGDTCQSTRVDINDGTAIFLKTATTGDAFFAEAESLSTLEGAACIRTPKVIGRGVFDRVDWLALEYLELRPLNSTSAALLGAGLAKQHQVGAARYGWSADNFLGRTHQSNPYCDDWAEFFCVHRLGVQRSLAVNAGRFTEDLVDVDAAISRARQELDGYGPIPSLLHGDLWVGNAAGLIAGSKISAAIFDPASYYGDRETDLAMTELFGGFPASFYREYYNVWPQTDGYVRRRDIYQLYHLLNHANLFGGSYETQAVKLAQQICRATD